MLHPSTSNWKVWSLFCCASNFCSALEVTATIGDEDKEASDDAVHEICAHVEKGVIGGECPASTLQHQGQGCAGGSPHK